MILNDDNYYDPATNLEYPSNSFYKMTLECEAAAMALADVGGSAQQTPIGHRPG